MSFFKPKRLPTTYVVDTVVGGYPKGEIPPRFTTKPIQKRRSLPPLFPQAMRLQGDGEVTTLLIGTDASLVVNGKHPDVIVGYLEPRGRLVIIGMVDVDVAWGAPLYLSLYEWKCLFRGQFERLAFWENWFRRI